MAAKDNANPIIHRPAAVSSTNKSTASSGGDWWRDDAIHVADEPYKLSDGSGGSDSGVEIDEKREEIDADEVFGR